MSKAYLLAAFLFLSYFTLEAQNTCKENKCNCNHPTQEGMDPSWVDIDSTNSGPYGFYAIRFYSAGHNEIGCWFTTWDDATMNNGGSMPCAEAIQRHYALKYPPNRYEKVFIPSGQALYRGHAHAIGASPGGGLQYCIIGKCDRVQFGTEDSHELAVCH